MAQMKNPSTSSFGDGKFSKENELTENMTIGPSQPDDFTNAMARGGRK